METMNETTTAYSAIRTKLRRLNERAESLAAAVVRLNEAPDAGHETMGALARIGMDAGHIAVEVADTMATYSMLSER